MNAPQTVEVPPQGNIIQQNPVITATVIVPLVAYVSTRYGLGFDTATASGIAACILAVGSWVARTFVTPVARAEKGIEMAKRLPPGSQQDVVL